MVTLELFRISTSFHVARVSLIIIMTMRGRPVSINWLSPSHPVLFFSRLLLFNSRLYILHCRRKLEETTQSQLLHITQLSVAHNRLLRCTVPARVSALSNVFFQIFSQTLILSFRMSTNSQLIVTLLA